MKRYEKLEENPLIEPERPRRKKPARKLSLWEEQAERWRGPSHAFKCCGTLYRAMNDATLTLMRDAHRKHSHAAA